MVVEIVCRFDYPEIIEEGGQNGTEREVSWGLLRKLEREERDSSGGHTEGVTGEVGELGMNGATEVKGR